MKHESAKKLALELMDKHKLLHRYNFRWCHGMKTLGWCNYDVGDCYISISKPFVETATRKQVREIILHEVAHALDHNIRGYTEHDEFWKLLFKKIGGSGNTLYHG